LSKTFGIRQRIYEKDYLAFGRHLLQLFEPCFGFLKTALFEKRTEALNRLSVRVSGDEDLREGHPPGSVASCLFDDPTGLPEGSLLIEKYRSRLNGGHTKPGKL